MYYLFNGPMFPCRWLDDEPFLKGISFWRGRIITEKVPEPLKYSLLPFNQYADDNHPELPPYFLGAYPLFRDDLISAMEKGGVDNLQYFKAVIHDPDNDEIYHNYKAINIIGLNAAADMNKSDATIHPGGPPLLDVDFDGLVVDESKTHDFKIFRLAESSNTVLVHESLVNHLLNSGFELYTDKEVRADKKPNPSINLTFLDPSKCAL